MIISESNLLKLLETVNKTFTSVTGQTISFIDRSGQWVIPLNLQMFTDFCSCVINSEKGSVRCKDCNDAFHNISGTDVDIAQCHMGLTMISVPIRFNGNCDLLITNAQFLLEGTEKEFYGNLQAKARQLDLDYHRILEASRRLKVLTADELMSRAQFLKILAEYITITEAELQARSRYLEELQQKLELENRLKRMEFKFLQSQISPHFLFNTLNLLVRVANKEGATRTANLIYDLSDLLRLAFKSKDSTCPLYEEFECVNSYLRIQKERLGELLNVEVDLDPRVRNERFPVLTIQPLVENVIVHGIRNDDQPVNILISARCQGDFIVIVVKDTGAGIPREVLEQIRNKETSGTGICNVEERLRLYFGEKMEFQIESMQDKGTTITIRCPNMR